MVCILLKYLYTGNVHSVSLKLYSILCHYFAVFSLPRPKKMPIFLVDLVLDQNGIYYSTPLEDFETSVVKLFNNAILTTCRVPQLEKVK